MALPVLSERAAAQIEAILAQLDRRLERYVLEGGTPPNPDEWLTLIEPLVQRSVIAAMFDIDPQFTQADLERAVAFIMGQIGQAVFNTIGQATRARAQMPPIPAEQDDGETILDFARRVGPFAALAALAGTVNRARRRRQFRATAQQVGARVQRPVSSYARMVVRTETAVTRNRLGADVVDRRNQQQRTLGYLPGDWALMVEDARLGPTDEPCEEVDGKIATPLWARRNPVEHPNCTRRTRPYRLRPGDVVTLLS